FSFMVPPPYLLEINEIKALAIALQDTRFAIFTSSSISLSLTRSAAAFSEMSSTFFLTSTRSAFISPMFRSIDFPRSSIRQSSSRRSSPPFQFISSILSLLHLLDDLALFSGQDIADLLDDHAVNGSA